MILSHRSVVSFLAFGLTFAVVPATAETTDRLHAIIEDAYGGVEPGAAVLLMQGNEIVLAEGVGLADLEWQQPVTVDTSFRIGSLSKPFTAIAVLQLVDAGAIDLDQPVSTYLPDLPGVLGRPSLRQLLGHTSGLPDHFALPEIVSIMRNPISPADITAMMTTTELVFDSGSEWRYSNFNYVLLGQVIEALDPEGRDYGRYVEEEIFEPLGMTNSHYDRQSSVIPRRARGYDHDGGKPINTITVETSLAYAAGALMSSAGDLARFTTALRKGELLEASTRDLAWTAVPLPDGSSAEYGLGFNVSRSLGETVIWHSGSINGFQAVWIHMPATDRTVAVLSNGYYRPNTTTIARRLLAEMAGQSVPDFETADFHDKAWLGLEGRYQLDDDRVLQIHVQEGVRLDLGGGWRELAYSGDELFYRPDTLSHLRVNRNPAGTITGLTYRSTTLERFEGTKTEGEIEGARRAIPMEPEWAAAIVGRWLMASGDAVVILYEDERLTLQLSQQPPYRIYPLDSHSYFMREQPISIVFSSDSSAAELDIYGRRYELKRE